MKETIRQDGSFEFWYPATIEKGSDGKMWVSGIASTADEDLQGEKIKQDGIQLDYFLKRGFFNDDHSKETGAKVGIPVEARITPRGLWTKGYLLNTKRAEEIYELATALNKAGGDRKLGFSVEGKVVGRDEKNPRVITKCWIKDIAITASPINPNTFLDIAKSFATQDITQVCVTGDDEDIAKGKVDELEAIQEATKKPTKQVDEEKEDADETAREALSDKKPKPELAKMLPDVPVAKRAGKSLVTLEISDDGSIIIKGLKLPKDDPGVVPQMCESCKKEGCEGHIDQHGKDENKTAKRVQMAAGDDTDKEAKVDKNATEVAKKETPSKVEKGIKEVCEKCDERPATITHNGKEYCKDCHRDFVEKPIPQLPVKKSEDTDLTKGFTVLSSLGGEREAGSKKIPIHTITYGHKPTGHTIQVTGKDGAFAVVHSAPVKGGKELQNIGGHVFADDPTKGHKAKDLVDDHLKGFGIKHKFADKDKLMGKSLVSAQEDKECEICKGQISKGIAFIEAKGKHFCDDSCIEKAMVAGYSFGVTDQAGGSALRVESLEGSQKDLSYGKYVLSTKVKDVKFDTARANGGQTQVTLKDAVEFLISRGLPQDMADRVLVLMVKNNGDISNLVKQTKGGK
jgi:hypothetical protein